MHVILNAVKDLLFNRTQKQILRRLAPQNDMSFYFVLAIANNRLLSVTDTEVRFRCQDYAHGNRRKVMTLTPAEFLRRFLLHVLPTGFMRIRHYGILANRAKREKLAAARTALDSAPAPQPPEPESVATFWLRVAALDIQQCPHCKAGRMIVIGPVPVPCARAPPLPPP